MQGLDAFIWRIVIPVLESFLLRLHRDVNRCIAQSRNSVTLIYLLKNQKNSFSITCVGWGLATASPLWQDISFSDEYIKHLFPSHRRDSSPGGGDTCFHHDAIHCFNGCAVSEKIQLIKGSSVFSLLDISARQVGEEKSLLKDILRI